MDEERLLQRIQDKLDAHEKSVQELMDQNAGKINRSIKAAEEAWHAAFNEHQQKISAATKEALRILDVTRCQTMLVHSAVHALLRTHPDRRALAAAFQESSDEMMKMIEITPGIHKDARAFAIDIRDKMLDRIRGVPAEAPKGH